MPDDNFPVMLKYASKNTSGTVMEIRFKLPRRDVDKTTSNIYGIGYQQYVGVIFPDSFISFSSTVVNCNLKSSTATYTTSFEAPTTSSVSSTQGLSNYLYCKLTDTTVARLPADTTLTLTLTFPTFFSSTFINSIGLFTSTSSSPDAVIIDYNHNIGSVSQYTDFASSVNNKIVEIASPGSNIATITSPSSASALTTLYPYFTIDLSVIVELKNFWMPFSEDFVHVLEYNSDSFSAPNSVKSDNITGSTNSNELALKTNLSLTNLSNGVVMINGIDGNDLYPKRKFRLTFSGIKTTDKNLGTQTSITYKVYYKNTYSVVSYSQINMDRVNIIPLTSTAHHTEFYTLFDGMGWPLQFNFKTPYDLPNGGYVVIRHQSFDKANNSFVFVASSCDFSEIQSVEQNYGKRWNCYPLRNNFAYADNTIEGKENHGIFFRMNALSASIDNYKLKVWGFAERCYTSGNTTDKFATTYSFTLRIYNTMTNSTLEEKRFGTTGGNYVIAQNTSVGGPKCYPLQLNFLSMLQIHDNTSTTYWTDAATQALATENVCKAGKNFGKDTLEAVQTDVNALKTDVDNLSTPFALVTGGTQAGCNADTTTAISTFTTNLAITQASMGRIKIAVDNILAATTIVTPYDTLCGSLKTDFDAVKTAAGLFPAAAVRADAATYFGVVLTKLASSGGILNKVWRLIERELNSIKADYTLINEATTVAGSILGLQQTATSMETASQAGGSCGNATLKTDITALKTALTATNTARTTLKTKFDVQLAAGYANLIAAKGQIETYTANVSTIIANSDPYGYTRLTPQNTKLATNVVGVEYTNIFAIKPPTTESDISNFGNLSTTLTPYSLYSNDPTKLFNGTTFTAEAYFFSSSSTLSDQNLLFTSAIRLASVSHVSLKAHDYIPSQCIDASSYKNYLSLDTAVVKWLFSRDFLTESKKVSDGCQVSWQTNFDNSDVSTTYDFNTNKFSTSTLFLSTSSLNTTSAYQTTITSKDISNTTANMDLGDTKINTSIANLTGTNIQYRIASKSFKQEATTPTLPKLVLNGATDCNVGTHFHSSGSASIELVIQMGVYTNCLKWVSQPSTLKSIFSYFDVQAQLFNGDFPLRVIRFIKVYPEVGLFQTDAAVRDASNNYGTTNKTAWIIGHYNVTTQTASPYAVCIIEVNAKALNDVRESSNTLILWLFATSLLDVDITNSASEYPIAPLTNTKAYGLNSGHTISAFSRMVTDNGGVLNSLVSAPKIQYRQSIDERSMSRLERVVYEETMGLYSRSAANIYAPLHFRRTHYTMFMSSIIYIPNVSSNLQGTNTSNIYIPILCPTFSDVISTSTTSTTGVYFVAPIVTAAWARTSAYNSINSIGSYIRPKNYDGTIPSFRGTATNNTFSELTKIPYKSTAGTEIFAPYHYALFKRLIGFSNVNHLFDINTTTFLGTSTTTQIYTNKAIALSRLKVSFKDFSFTQDTDVKYIGIEANELSTDTASTTAIGIYLSPSMPSLDTSITATIPDITVNMYSYSSSTNFYINGKPFTRFVAFSKNQGSANNFDFPFESTAFPIASYNTNIKSSSIMFVSGISRLPISIYDSPSNIIDIRNHIAIFFNTNYGIATDALTPTSTTALRSIIILTNLIIDTASSSSALNDFVIFHPTANTSDWTNRVFDADIQTESYKSDKGSNFRISGTLLSEVPVGSLLSLTISSSAVTSSNSVCGLIENGLNGLATECVISGSIVQCNLKKRSSKFEVCCYNVTYQTTAISISTASLTFPMPTSLSQFTSIAYLASYYNPTVAGWNTYIPQLSTDVTSTTFFAKLNSIIYTYSNTIGGFGQARLEIILPRAPVRGMTLEVIGDFSSMVISNVKSRLVATFGNNALFGFNQDEGDILIQDLYTNFDSNGIKLKLKNIIYKCGLNFSRTLNIFLWPIKTENIVNQQVSINLKSTDSTLLANALSHTVSSVPNLTVSPIVSLLQADFCKITSISPRFIEEYATYTFEIDLKQFTSALDGTKPNELFIYFPWQKFGEGQVNDIVCSFLNAYQSCEFIDKSLLAVRFSSTVPTTGETPLSIKVIGIINPYLLASNQTYFACTLNESNFNTGFRRQLIRGTYTLNDGILYTNDTPNGNIRILNKFTYHTVSISDKVTKTIDGLSVKGISPLNPREQPDLTNISYATLHQFGWTIDIANNFIATDTGYVISDSPYLTITFPKDYKFSWFIFNISAQIQAFKLNSADLKTIEQYTPLTVSSVSYSGNQVVIKFVETSITIDKYHQYFLVKLYNIPPPVDNTGNTATGKQTTGAFKFILNNTTNTRIFRTWTNLNTFSQEEILPTKSDLLLSYNKGFKFEFDQKKWIIDVTDKERQMINNIIVRAGRYMKYGLKFRTTSKLLKALKVRVKLSDNKFQLLEQFYEINTSSNVDAPFQIGVACGETPGKFVFNMDYIKNSSGDISNVYDNIMPLSPTMAEIRTDIKGVIMFTSLYTVRINGSIFVDFTASDPTFEQLEINFVPFVDSVIENSKIPAGKTTVRTVMRLTNAVTTETQSYAFGASNSECFAYQYDKIQFIIDGIAAIIPNDGVKASEFEYRNSSMDSEITEKNSVRFIFTTPYTQIYIYAVLTCINLDFPTDDQMKNQNVTETSSTGYYSEILNIVGSATIDFTNLIRGQKYKLKVFIESTQGDKSLRTSSSITLQNYTLSNGTVLDLMPTKPVTTLCASYRFNTKPGVQVKDPLRWYWQNKFSVSGYNTSGCVTVIDQYGVQAPGLPDFSNQTSCGRAACIFRNYQDSIVNQTSLGVAETYIVCPKPNPVCITDPSNYEEKFNEVYNDLPTNQTFKTILNIEVVPEFVLTQVSDSSNVSTPTVSDIKSTGATVTFSAVSTINLDCAFVATTGATPTQDQFDKCVATECTYINTSATSTTGQIKLSSTASGSYTIFSQCKNEVPCSESQSDITNVGSTSVTGPDAKPTNTSNTNTTGTNTTNTTTPSSTSYISFNLLLCMIMIIFLMN
jgi:hypothetical protein